MTICYILFLNHSTLSFNVGVDYAGLAPMENDQLPLFNGNVTDEDSEIVSFMALSKIRGVGLRSLRILFEGFEQLSSIWEIPEDKLLLTLRKYNLPRPSSIVDEIKTNKKELVQAAKIQLAAFNKRNISIVLRSDPRFPNRLNEIPNPPYWLFIEGNVGLLSQPNLIAVVGTRNPSALGICYAKKVTALLAKNGFCIVSGLAEGIDATVHRTALDFGAPCVAVLGTGISIIFPRTTADLRQGIVESGGALVTEYLPYESYQKARFVQRNRIQAALSYAVIPVEWNEKGGTAHTVRFAEQYGRIVITIVENHPVAKTLVEKNDRRFSITLESPLAESDLVNLLLGEQPNTYYSRRQVTGNLGAFSGLLTNFMRIVREYPISEQEYEGLRSAMQEKWQEISRRHGSKGIDS